MNSWNGDCEYRLLIPFSGITILGLMEFHTCYLAGKFRQLWDGFILSAQRSRSDADRDLGIETSLVHRLLYLDVRP
jgi:hypothetical protein